MRSNAARRIAKRRLMPAILLIIILATLVLADRSGWLFVGDIDDMAAYHGKIVRVVRVIDGDTIDIDQPDVLNRRPVTRVRLTGIDCPETSRYSDTEEFGAELAAEFTRSLTQEQMIRLHLESYRTRGRFGRVLAHVYLADGRNVNEELLAAGLAQMDDRWPHTRLVRYAQLEQQARKQGVGIWTRDR